MTALAPAPLLGVQTPRIGSWPEYRSTSGPEVVEHAAGAGVFLDPWQRLAVDVACAERENGNWSTWEFVLIVCRQNGKNEVIVALQLADLFLFDDVRTILHSAHEYYASQVQFQRLTGIINNAPHLKKRIDKMPQGSGEEAIWTADGTHLKFIARKTTGTSGRSYTVDRLYFDEAFALAASAVGGIMPALSAVRNPWIGYFSSSGMAYSTQLHTLRKRGIAGDDTELAYLEWSVPEGSDRADRRNWAVANPALGYRITEAHVARELTSMPALEFDRERLGIWDGPQDEVPPVIAETTWADLADTASQIDGPMVFAIDRGPDGWTSIGAAGRRTDGRWHVELISYERGAAWVVDRVVALDRVWRPEAWVLDSVGATGALIPPLQEAKIELTVLNAGTVISAHSAFLDAVREDRLRHLDQEQLNSALVNSKQRMVGDGGMAWGRKLSEGDISPLVAVTNALHGHALTTAGGSGSFLDNVR